MTRNEIAKLLNMMFTAYPHTKISDASMMLDAWEMAFGDEDATVIYKSARYHMRTCKFFPTIADIMNGINKGELLYGESKVAITASNQGNLPAPSAPVKKICTYCDGAWACPYFEGDICYGTKEEYEACNI